MISRADATEVQRLGLEAISLLVAAVDIIVSGASEETLAQLKRGAGLSIGVIDVELLSVLYKIYPDMDDLRDR